VHWDILWGPRGRTSRRMPPKAASTKRISSRGHSTAPALSSPFPHVASLASRLFSALAPLTYPGLRPGHGRLSFLPNSADVGRMGCVRYSFHRDGLCSYRVLVRDGAMKLQPKRPQFQATQPNRRGVARNVADQEGYIV
jgi:hypothetical protein